VRSNGEFLTTESTRVGDLHNFRGDLVLLGVSYTRGRCAGQRSVVHPFDQVRDSPLDFTPFHGEKRGYRVGWQAPQVDLESHDQQFDGTPSKLPKERGHAQTRRWGIASVDRNPSNAGDQIGMEPGGQSGDIDAAPHDRIEFLVIDPLKHATDVLVLLVQAAEGCNSAKALRMAFDQIPGPQLTLDFGSKVVCDDETDIPTTRRQSCRTESRAAWQ